MDEPPPADKLPCGWCADEYKCAVALNKHPKPYFFSILDYCTLLDAGFTIENNLLSLDEWFDVGTLRSCLKSRMDMLQTRELRDSLMDAITKVSNGTLRRK